MNESRPIKQTLLFLLAILIVTALCLTIIINPAGAYRIDTLNVTTIIEDGDITFDDPGYTRDDTDSIIDAYETADRRGYIEFNTSIIGYGATIEKVELRFRTENSAEDPEVFEMASQPSESSDSVVYADAGDGDKYLDLENLATTTWYTYDLGSEAVTKLQSQVDGNITWFAVGVVGMGTSGTYIESEESANDAYLIVYYHRPDDYVVNLDGLYYENGTAVGAVEVSAYLSNETQTFEVNGTEDYHFWERPILFSWDIGAGNARRIYTYTDNENFTLYSPETTYAVYEFEIKDYTGRLGDGGYLESIRNIGGDDYLIERMAIIDVINDVPLILVTSQTYTIRVRFEDGTTYTFGFFVSGVDPTPTIAITEIEFDQQAQITYRHLSFDALRPTPTQITVNYNDTRMETVWANLTIAYRNGTAVYTASTENDTAQFNWASANAHLDYLVIVEVYHEFYGYPIYREIVAPTRSFYDFIDIGIVGTFGPLSTGNLFSFIIMALIALSCSIISAELGAFTALAVGGILRSMGANDFSYTYLAVCFAFVIIYTLTKRRGAG